MIDIDPQEIKRANAVNFDDPENQTLENREKEAAIVARAQERVYDIKCWSHIAKNFNRDDLDNVRKDHLERLARYRKRKPWEAWVEEDEMDLEGERMLSEIKNYKAEHFFNTRFYT